MAIATSTNVPSVEGLVRLPRPVVRRGSAALGIEGYGVSSWCQTRGARDGTSPLPAHPANASVSCRVRCL